MDLTFYPYAASNCKDRYSYETEQSCCNKLVWTGVVLHNTYLGTYM